MNGTVYTMIADRLALVSELKWIDLETGQIDLQDERPPVSFPACIIDIGYPRTEDLSFNQQLVTAQVSLRLAFKCNHATNNYSPKRNDAMAIFDVVDKVHGALQGWSNESLSQFSRIRAVPEKRRDGLKVYLLVYETSFSELSEFTEPDPPVA